MDINSPTWRNGLSAQKSRYLRMNIGRGITVSEIKTYLKDDSDCIYLRKMASCFLCSAMGCYKFELYQYLFKNLNDELLRKLDEETT